MKNKKIIITITIVLLVLISQYSIKKQKILIIYDTENKKESIIDVSSNKFTLTFIHSVQQTPVYEFFKIREDNTLSLVKTEFSSFGIGLPYTDEGGKFKIKDDKFILEFERNFDKIPIRISPIPQHSIIVNNKTYPLLKFADPENLIEIYAKDKWKLQKRKRGDVSFE